MKKDYLTIKEYAEIRGVSVSSVYKRLSTTLQNYVGEVEGQKVLKYQVIIDEGLEGVEEVSLEGCSTVEQEQNSTNYDKIIQLLTMQLKEKDKQIERLQEDLRRGAVSSDEKDKYIQEQGRRLAELLEQSNKLQENNQVLIGLANDYKAKIEEGTSSAGGEKKGFFHSLFKK